MSSYHNPSLLIGTLKKCTLDAIAEETGDFQWDVFFQLWFRNEGKPAFFLFRRHLGVTNAQYVELFSLLEVNCRRSADPGNEKSGVLLFHTTEQLRSLVVGAINAILDAPENEKAERVQQFAEMYVEVFASSVIVHMFYCSCAVFLPPGVDLDLHEVAVAAGYVHSAGHSVFIRNMAKSKRHDFESSVERYLATVSNQNLPVPFIVYAHEDFSAYDGDSRALIGRGIESTKLYLEKLSMGVYSLSYIVNNMRKQYEGRLAIPEPGPYTEIHDFQSSRTLWLICDRSVSSNDPRYPGRGRYYICYEQIVKDENPFFFFDENKPAWKSHTTLPHSLTGALLNTAIASLRSTSCSSLEKVALCDPFGGTGTSWFEAKRLSSKLIISCSDKSPITQLIAQDNLHFFLLTSAELADLETELATIGRDVQESSVASEGQTILDFGADAKGVWGRGPYLEALRLLEELQDDQPDEDQEYEFTPKFVAYLEKLPFITRFIFYVVLRAALRYQGGYKRGALTFEKAFKISLEELIEQIAKLRTLRNALETQELKRSGRYVVFSDTYSEAVVPSMFLESEEQLRSRLASEIRIQDACDLECDKYDAIICDPPYGFNTREEQSDLAGLYSRFIRAAILAIRRQGHLIFCLPAESYTGRDLPYCTKSELVVNQVLTEARALGREAYLPARNIPGRLLSPPYYWEAERALRRVILHFRFL